MNEIELLSILLLSIIFFVGCIQQSNQATPPAGPNQAPNQTLTTSANNTPSQSTHLTFRVYEIDENKTETPAADARLDLYDGRYFIESSPYEFYTRGYGDEVKPLKTVYTDKSGIAEFDVSVANYSGEVTKAGYTTEIYAVHPGDTHFNTTLHLVGPIRVQVVNTKVQVTTSNDKSVSKISGAKVDLYNNSPFAYSEFYREGYYKDYNLVKTLYTDSNGTVDFGKLDIWHGTFVISKDGYQTASRTIDQDPDSRNWWVNLRELNDLVFNVTEEAARALNNSPVAGARVDLYNSSYDNYDDEFHARPMKTLYTDTNGVVNFGKLDMEGGQIMVSKDGYYIFDSPLFFQGDVRNIHLDEIKPLVVTVYDISQNSSENLAGATVKLYHLSGYDYVLLKTAETDSNGEVNFGIVNMDYGKITAEKEGYEKEMSGVPLCCTDVYFYGLAEVPFFMEKTNAQQTYNISANATDEYPLIMADGDGCNIPDKAQAPPEFMLGEPDGKGACFWENKPIYGTFGKLINISGLRVKLYANNISVNQPVQVLISTSDECFDEASARNGVYYTGNGPRSGLFGSYKVYSTFTPDLSDGYKEYNLSNGTVSAKCVALKDTTNDGYGYYIDSIAVIDNT